MFKAMLYQYWSPMVALVAAGVLSAVYFGLTGAVWAVTGEFTLLGADILGWFHVDTSHWVYLQMFPRGGTTFTRASGLMVWGMFAGALVMVLLNNSFKLRLPLHKRRIWQALLGGVIAGFGARMAMGCNLAAFFTGVPQFSFHAWLFIVTAAAGSYLGTKIIRQRWWRGRPPIKKACAANTNRVKRCQPVVGVILVLMALGLIVMLVLSQQLKLAYGLLFGVLFGVLLERGQICFTSALRDLWLFNNSTMSRAIIVGMAVSAVLTLGFALYGQRPLITQITALSTLLGGFLFGLGIVLASACETGMMYRMMEGQVVYLVAFIGNIVGATVLAYGWDHWHIAAALTMNGEKINLVSRFDSGMALLYTLAFLALLYAVVVWRARTRTTGFLGN